MKRKLDASVEASGPHDFAVRLHHRSSAVLSASIASRAYVRDDRDTPLMWDGMARLIVLIWVRPETECFFKWDWTAQIILIRFNKFVPARKWDSVHPALNLRGDLFQADQAGERAHFLLLI